MFPNGIAEELTKVGVLWLEHMPQRHWYHKNHLYPEGLFAYEESFLDLSNSVKTVRRNTNMQARDALSLKKEAFLFSFNV